MFRPHWGGESEWIHPFTYAPAYWESADSIFSDRSFRKGSTTRAGTITTGLITKASTVVAVGVKTFTATTAASTGACALKIGDLINIAGHPYTYTLTAAATQASAATDVTIAVEPGLQVALAGSEAITVVASHAANLAFHPSWAAFAMLPMNSIKRKVAITQTFIHEKSGIPLRLYIEEESRQFRFALEAFYGIKEVRTECAVRVLGA